LPGIVWGAANNPHSTHADGSRRALAFFSDFPPAQRILDVGCGSGEHLRELADSGHNAIGVEPDPEAVGKLRAQGYNVVQGTAERLPFDDGSFDAIVCSVVVPYTDERLAIAEWSRVLRPGGQVRASFHGLAYPLQQIVKGPGWRVRLYGGRTILNSGIYRIVGRRLPGFWGDTLYQSTGRLKRYYAAAALQLRAEYIRPGIAGLRDVFFHQLKKAS
jgi:SAM-dependent methyltransferase